MPLFACKPLCILDTTISSHQFQRMIEQLQRLQETQQNIDIKTILHQVSKASIDSIKEIECEYVITHGTKYTSCSEFTIRFQLQDGRKAIIRPLISSDKERLKTGISLAGLGTFSCWNVESWYLVYEIYDSDSSLVRSSAELFDWHRSGRPLCSGSAARHCKLSRYVKCALHLRFSLGVAVARYIRDYKDPTVAEWAVTVVDEYQGQQIGHILLYMLSQVSISFLVGSKWSRLPWRME